MTPPTDPFLHLPLTGTRLIEASAGTGKTFTLATLVTRLVVERRLRISQILAVTFTDAATQELRKRIRERLALAASLVPDPVGAAMAASGSTDQPADSSDPQPGQDGADPGTGESPSPPWRLPQGQQDPAQDAAEAPDIALSRAIIAAHLQTGEETPAQLRRRLRQAADEIDLAAIFTIHGFCARVLREHALESDQTFAAPELLANDRALRDELAADLWRTTAADATQAPLLMTLWPAGPEALARDLDALIRQPVLLPPLPAQADDPERSAAELHRASQALADAFAIHGDALRAALLEAVEAKILNGQSYKAAWIHELWDDLAQRCARGDWSTPPHPKLALLAPEALETKTNRDII